MPVIGDLNDLFSIAFGYDVIRGEELTPEQRFASLKMMLLTGTVVPGNAARGITGAADEVAEAIGDVAGAAAKGAGTALQPYYPVTDPAM